MSDGGAPPGQGAGGNTSSEYTNVETSNPEGFLLYYTGDYGNEFLDLLDERRKGSPAFYGDILRDLQVEYTAVDPNATTSQNSGGDAPSEEALAGMFRRNRNRNLPAGNVGGGAPAGNSPPPTQADDSVGSTTSGGNSPARPAAKQSRAQRVSGSGPSAVPDGETLGTLAPGVMLLHSIITLS